MNALHIFLAFIAAAVVGSFSDWYFFGVLFHKYYGTTPGIWRQYKNKKDEMRTVWVSQIWMSFSSLVFILACAHEQWMAFPSTIAAAVTVWLMIPLPLLIVNSFFIPMDKKIVVSHSLGWLVRLIITAVCASLLI